MAYSKKQNEYNKKYVKEHQKQIMIKYKIEEYEEVIKPAIDRSGLPAATYIKNAVIEKIKREN